MPTMARNRGTGAAKRTRVPHHIAYPYPAATCAIWKHHAAQNKLQNLQCRDRTSSAALCYAPFLTLSALARHCGMRGIFAPGGILPLSTVHLPSSSVAGLVGLRACLLDLLARSWFVLFSIVFSLLVAVKPCPSASRQKLTSAPPIMGDWRAEAWTANRRRCETLRLNMITALTANAGAHSMRTLWAPPSAATFGRVDARAVAYSAVGISDGAGSPTKAPAHRLLAQKVR